MNQKNNADTGKEPSRDDLTRELADFIHATESKISKAMQEGKTCLAGILKKIKKDMKKSLECFEASSMSFHEVYEEITSLHVFTEMYLSCDAQDTANG